MVTTGFDLKRRMVLLFQDMKNKDIKIQKTKSTRAKCCLHSDKESANIHLCKYAIKLSMTLHPFKV